MYFCLSFSHEHSAYAQKENQRRNQLVISVGSRSFGSFDCLKWKWRESNPRPNKEPPGFLHAYSAVGFRAVQGSERPKRDLISLVSPCRRSADTTIPKLLSTPYSGRNQESPPAGCFVHPPCERIKPVTYYTSVRQRKRSYSRQLFFCSQDLRASLRGSACLHDNSSCCQNHTSPFQLFS